MLASPPELSHSLDGNCLVVSLGGSWGIGSGQSGPRLAQGLVERCGAGKLRFTADRLGDWDSSLLACVAGIVKKARTACAA